MRDVSQVEPGWVQRRTRYGGMYRTLGAVRRSSYLIRRLTVAELRRDGAGLLLGEAWWIADPLIQMLIYSLVVGVIFARGLADYPLFVLAALLPWKAFAATAGAACSAITGNERIIRQVAFPRMVLPVAVALAEFFRFAVGLSVLAALMVAFWSDRLTLSLAWLPVLAVAEFIFILPLALILAAATVFVRDLANVVRHALRMLFYLSPVLYGLPQVLGHLPVPLQPFYQFNPIAALLDGYRAVVYDGVAPDPASLISPIGFGLLLIAPAVLWFRRMDPSFAKVL